MKICTVENCDRKMRSNGLCAGHVSRKRRGLSLDGPIIPRGQDYPLSDRFWGKVEQPSHSDCWEWRGTTASTGYGKLTNDGEQVYAHRFAWELANGPMKKGAVVDHLCHNKTCVNPVHLRVCSIAENVQNAAGLRVDNTSGYRNVTFNRSRGKWYVRVKAFGKIYYGGGFHTPEEANAKAEEMRAELHPMPAA